MMSTKSKNTEHYKSDEEINRNLYEKQCIVTDLVSALRIVTNEKLNLDHENVALRLENQELKEKLAAIELCVNGNDKLHSEGGVHNLENQKLSVLEVSNLKESYCKQRELYEQRQHILLSQIEQLKKKLNQHTKVLNDSKLKAERNYNKYISYKKKVKQAVLVIKNLVKTKKVKSTSSKTCQTDSITHSTCRSSGLDIEYDVLLSNLFFNNINFDEVQSLFLLPNTQKLN